MIKRTFFCLIISICIFSIFNLCTRDQWNNEPSENGKPSEPTSELIQPDDLEYKGAFRLPGGSNGTNWEWSGNAMAYNPGGDPDGPTDGFPGSIFATGHNWEQQISEIDIPVPIISQTKNLNHLNTASTLQEFHDIRSELVNDELELPRVGLAILPKQGSQTTGKLYFCWGEHFQEVQVVSHGWCEPDLSNPKTGGGWYIGERSNYSTNDYLFEIPEAWATTYISGKRLATGRYRDGGWSGQGPSLFAIGPWDEGNPPPPNAHINEIPLILYTSTLNNPAVNHTMNNYHHSDEWSGGVWLTAGNNGAVIFAGTKGMGECWYGFSNGVGWPDEPPYPEIPDPPHDDRGWWSTEFRGQFVFYNPSDLAKVAQGTMEPHESQPYTSMDIDDYLFGIGSPQQKFHLGDVSFDTQRDLLYVFEFRADGDKCLVHVWKVNT